MILHYFWASNNVRRTTPTARAKANDILVLGRRQENDSTGQLGFQPRSILLAIIDGDRWG